MYNLLKKGNTVSNKSVKEDYMRRESRRKQVRSKTTVDKIILYAGIGVAILAVIVFALFMYSKTLSDDVRKSTMTLEEMANSNPEAMMTQ